MLVIQSLFFVFIVIIYFFFLRKNIVKTIESFKLIHADDPKEEEKVSIALTKIANDQAAKLALSDIVFVGNTVFYFLTLMKLYMK
jgi:hypothetical protein